MASLWNNDEFNAFATAQNKQNYNNYKSQLEKNWDNMDLLSKIGSGLSGGGWNKSDYLSKYGLDSNTDQYGQAGLLGTSDMNTLRSSGSAYDKEFGNRLAQNKGLFNGFNDIPVVGGLISGILNAPAQAVGAGKDLVGAVTSGNWDTWNKRDHVSDAGAGLETLLDIATMGAGSGAKAGAKGLASTALKSGALGAGYGATSYMNEAGDENFNLGDLAKSSAMSGAFGGALGAGIYGLGKGVGKLQDYAKNNRKVVTNNPASTQPLQNALDTLNTANGTRYSANPTNLPTLRGVGTLDELDANTLKDLYKKASRNTHPDLGGSAQAFSQVNDANKVLNDWIAGGKVMPSNTTISYPGLAKSGFGQTLQGAGDLFKNNRLAKVGAGVGGGLLLGKLLSGGGSTGTPTYTDGMGNYYDENGNLIGGM